jgi:hypothetical protein
VKRLAALALLLPLTAVRAQERVASAPRHAPGVGLVADAPWKLVDVKDL